MDIKIECKNCSKVLKADLDGIIKALHDSVEKDSIYGGFLCKDCADELLDENY